VPKAIEVAKQAIKDGNSVVLGLQATGEARTKDAVEGVAANEAGEVELDDYVSAPKVRS
jgi:hypothetical protein